MNWEGEVIISPRRKKYILQKTLIIFAILIICFLSILINTGGFNQKAIDFTIKIGIEAAAVGISLIILDGIFFITEEYMVDKDNKESIEKFADKISEIVGFDISSPDSPIHENNYRGVNTVAKWLDFDDMEYKSRNASNLIVVNTWLPQDFYTKNIIINVIKNKGNVRILLPSRNSHWAKARAENLPDIDIKNKIIHSYELIYRIYIETIKNNISLGSSTVGNIELRLFNGSSPSSIYGLDGVLHVGMFVIENEAVNSFQFRAHAGSEYGKYFLEQFELMWERSSSVDLGSSTSTWVS